MGCACLGEGEGGEYIYSFYSSWAVSLPGQCPFILQVKIGWRQAGACVTIDDKTLFMHLFVISVFV
jgi:hypothetical protein